jgi:hypothetical protein
MGPEPMNETAAGVSQLFHPILTCCSSAFC